MNLKNYFDIKRGTGILSTADGSGRVNAAIYARPHFLESGEIAFIAAERRTRANLLENPRACYLFTEAEDPFSGVRLYLTMTGESEDAELIRELRRRERSDDGKRRFLVRFRVDETRALLGDGAPSLE